MRQIWNILPTLIAIVALAYIVGVMNDHQLSDAILGALIAAIATLGGIWAQRRANGTTKGP